MKRIHLIAIGGAAMHNLAIELKNKGYLVSGSDDEIFEPSLSRLKSHGLLPSAWGWDTSRIHESIDAIILGMHARKENPELLRAMELGIKIYSYPEFLFEQTKDKTRIVIAGSHGKTTITAMIIHVLKTCDVSFDFMVGSQIEGFETMVSLNSDSKLAVFEGDEYLSSPIDLQSKFMHYKPHIALISGIAWDHINVFPTYESYVESFRKFTEIIQPGGHLIYYAEDKELQWIANAVRSKIERHPYEVHDHELIHEVTYLNTLEKQRVKLDVFGNHNLQNISGAKIVCNLVGVDDKAFYQAISGFTGTARRLQLIRKTADSHVYIDFAHSPSKVKATVSAVKLQYPDKTLIAVLELHTYSSLNRNFISEYAGSLNAADNPIVYFSNEVIQHKGLQGFTMDDIKYYFKSEKLLIFNDSKELEQFFRSIQLKNVILLLMSSGNFGGVKVKEIFKEL